MTIKYIPFHNRKHLIKRALEAAIHWELSRIDAGICDNDPEELSDTKACIKAYRKYYKELSGGTKTQLERIDEKLSKCSSIPIDELVKNKGFIGKIKP